jgi:putative DNA primase/helicase
VNDDGADRGGIEIPDADPLRLAFFEQSDLGNAERLKALAGGKLKWIEDLQLWAWYDGKRFDVERGAVQAQRLAHQVIRHIRTEAAAIYDLHDRCEKGETEALELLTRLKGAKYGVDNLKSVGSGLLKHALKSGSAGMTSGMLRQARSDLAALAEDFDADPLAYNCRNRTLRFVQVDGKWTVRAAPHDPADMLMKLADVDYEPGADCPFWKERLAQLQPDPEQFAALKPLYGYTLTGLTSDQAFYVHQGRGNDGKSATQQALGELHGDYYRHAGVKSFLQGAERGGAEHRSDLVRLAGDVRFVTCDEPKPRAVWDGETIKQVTGSLITARGSGDRTEITYKPRFKLHPECNLMPRAPSDDKGFRRRFKLFQWTVSLPLAGEEGHMPIDQVLGRLRDERSGILNWLIEGALQWLETRTIPQPKAMASVLSDFWSASSPMSDWMDEWCDCADSSVRSYAKDLYAHFKQWCEGQGIEQVPTSAAFGNALRDKQFARIKDSKGLVMRKGIRLLSDAEHDALFAGGAAPPLARAAASFTAERSQGGEVSGLGDEDVP